MMLFFSLLQITADTDFSSLLHYLSSRGIYTVLVTKEEVELRMLLGPDRIEIWDKLQHGDDPIPEFFARATSSAPTNEAVGLNQRSSEGGGGRGSMDADEDDGVGGGGGGGGSVL